MLISCIMTAPDYCIDGGSRYEVVRTCSDDIIEAFREVRQYARGCIDLSVSHMQRCGDAIPTIDLVNKTNHLGSFD